MKLFSFFTLNFFLNAVFVFTFSCLFIEIGLFLLRVKNFRMRYIARSVPIFKLLFDILNYSFSRWAILAGINPHLAEKGTRHLYLGFGVGDTLPFLSINLGFDIGEIGKTNTFSPSDLLALHIGDRLTWILSLTLLSIACIKIVAFLITWYKKNRIVKDRIKTSTPIEYIPKNGSLYDLMRKKQINIALCETINAPCLLKKKRFLILFPKELFYALSSDQKEAILAHEIAHISWKDHYLSTFFTGVRSLFLFLPFLSIWMRKWAFERECACDAYAKKKIDPISLAEALQKAIQFQKREFFSFDLLSLSFCKESKKDMCKRVRSSLFIRKRKTSLQIIQGIFLCLFLYAILFGRIWIF